jgi:hypothetical protein
MVHSILPKFNRVNLLGKYSAVLDDNSKFHYPPLAFQVPGTHLDKYHNDWWIRTISRFGSVDDTEGGTTEQILMHREQTYR